MTNAQDRLILRDLAKRVAEIASLPVMETRRQRWARLNQLQPVKPMLYINPEGAWRELLPRSGMQCEDENWRSAEWELRSRIYRFEHFHDDSVIEKTWMAPKQIATTNWGLDIQRHESSESHGAWGYAPVIKEADDFKKLRFPEVTYDEAATRKAFTSHSELFGDILDVQLQGVSQIHFVPIKIYAQLRGLEQMYLDMCDAPGMVHDALAFLEEGYKRLLQQYVAMNLLSLNNGGARHSPGGPGYTAELPKAGFDPGRVRPCDMWTMSQAQELTSVSPAMYEAFAVAYARRMVAPFGLTSYGCCEDLTKKLDCVFSIPNLRRISVSPFANVEKCAERIQNRYIFSWKPHPSHLVGRFDPNLIHDYAQQALTATKNCAVEIILADTHTCENKPERFTEWSEIVEKLILEQ